LTEQELNRMRRELELQFANEVMLEDDSKQALINRLLDFLQNELEDS